MMHLYEMGTKYHPDLTDPVSSKDKENNETLAFRENLLVHYSFDEQYLDEAISDETGNERHGSLFGYSGGRADLVNGKLGNALQMDGVDDTLLHQRI